MKPTTHDPSLRSLHRRDPHHAHPADTPRPPSRTGALALSRRHGETVTTIMAKAS